MIGVMFTVPTLSVNALSKTGIGHLIIAGKGQSGGYYTSGRIWKNTGKLTYYNVAGKTCLCLNKAKPFGDHRTYKGYNVSSIDYKGYQRNWLKPVLMFSYGSKTAPPYGNKADKFAASQMVIWQLGAKEIGKNTSKLNAHKSGYYYNVLKKHKYGLKNYNWIIKRVNQWKTGPSFSGKRHLINSVQTTINLIDYNSYQKYSVKSAKNLKVLKVTKDSKGKYKYTVKILVPNKTASLTLADSQTVKSGAWYVYKSGKYQPVSAIPPSDTKTYTVNFAVVN